MNDVTENEKEAAMNNGIDEKPITATHEGGVAPIGDDDRPKKGAALEYDNEHVIRNGYDVSEYLISDRDDGDRALTLRSITLGTLAAIFQATLNQIYLFKPTNATVTGAFLLLMTYFLGKGWQKLFPTSKKLRAKYPQEDERTRSEKFRIGLYDFLNPGPFGLKEHAVAAITANSASQGAEALLPFTVQKIFYDVNLTPGLVIMSLISITLFGYGLAGIFRPFAVYPSYIVYWGNLPLIQLFQKIHWERVSLSKPLRYFWYSFAIMSVYEIFPAYIAIWLVAFSVPCLASMHAPKRHQRLLTNLFGGSVSNEGLGWFSLCLDWQYIQSFAVAGPLISIVSSGVGLIICYFVFLALYYGNAWNARHLPFLSTRLLTDTGEAYAVKSVFVNGILDEDALAKLGTPKLTATYTWAMLTNNAAIGASIGHSLFFWRREVWQSIKEAFQRKATDRHHKAMLKYPEVHWFWYAALAVLSFVLGAVVNATEHTTLPLWAYLVAVVVGIALTPFAALLGGRLGAGIATNIVMKMIAGVMMPGRPVANLYFAAWSHAILSQAVALCADLKMGQYLKIPPRVLFASQVYGVTLGTFVNYAIMIQVVDNNKEVLLSQNGNGVWTGAFFQSINVQASVWALSKYLYASGKPYVIVPFGVLIGFSLVALQFLIHKIKPKFGPFEVKDIAMMYICLNSGVLGYWATQSCVMLTNYLAGFYAQYYLRNWKPKIFKNYVYIVAAGLDGGSLLVIFILSFAVYGAVGTAKPFPTWFGNPAGYPDHCPDPDA